MTPDTQEYLSDQLALFEGGYDHIMLELICHFHSGQREIQVGVKIVDHRTHELIAYQVPVITGDTDDMREMAIELCRLFRFVREHISPF